MTWHQLARHILVVDDNSNILSTQNSHKITLQTHHDNTIHAISLTKHKTNSRFINRTPVSHGRSMHMTSYYKHTSNQHKPARLRAPHQMAEICCSPGSSTTHQSNHAKIKAACWKHTILIQPCELVAAVQIGNSFTNILHKHTCSCKQPWCCETRVYNNKKPMLEASPASFLKQHTPGQHNGSPAKWGTKSRKWNYSFTPQENPPSLSKFMHKINRCATNLRTETLGRVFL